MRTVLLVLAGFALLVAAILMLVPDRVKLADVLIVGLIVDAILFMSCAGVLGLMQ